jgi:hypothetical protein|tara:strand:- start:648 stop:929 length:282 start_codon:yes stop_codon:yes gene_type:complete
MKITKAQLMQVIKEELMREQGDEQLYDLLKGERPPPRSTDQHSLRDPDPGTERRSPRRVIDQVSGLVGEMVTSGMTKEQIMSMVESHVDFLVQ